MGRDLDERCTGADEGRMILVNDSFWGLIYFLTVLRKLACRVKMELGSSRLKGNDYLFKYVPK